MINQLNQAFALYATSMEAEINQLLQQGVGKPCPACAENIAKIEQHAAFDPTNPRTVSIPVDETFDLQMDHVTRLSEHCGMPVDTSHDLCKTCFTNFYYKFEGFDSDQVYSFKPATLTTIQDYQEFLGRQKTLYLQKFAPFLQTYLQEQTEDVTVYVSLDPQLKRANHEDLTVYYTKEGYTLEKLNQVNVYASEAEAFTAGRMGRLFEREFLQQLTYPAAHVQAKYSLYSRKVELTIDVRQGKERSFFDVYQEAFVPFDALDRQRVHMVKRNEDTYTFFDKQKKHYQLKPMTAIDEIHRLFDQYFQQFEKEILFAVFGDAYKAYRIERAEKQRSFNSFFEGLKEFGKQKRKHQVQQPTTLKGFKQWENVTIQEGIYRNLTACIKEIDFTKGTLGLVFFGETNFRNVIHVNPELCQKVESESI